MSFPMRDEQRVLHMIEACRRIMEFTDVEKRVYDESLEKQAAVIHYFSVLGEAASRVSDGFRFAHDEIEWHKASGMRNRLVHDYMATDPEIVWGAARRDVPVMLARLEALGLAE